MAILAGTPENVDMLCLGEARMINMQGKPTILKLASVTAVASTRGKPQLELRKLTAWTMRKFDKACGRAGLNLPQT